MHERNFISDTDLIDRNMTEPQGSDYPLIPPGNITAMSDMPVGILVLELNANDYSMAHIAHIVEDNDAKIMSSCVRPVADSVKIEVVLKINQTDLTSVIQSFQRYNYTIKASFHNNHRQEDVLRKNYDHFMLYLNV